MSSVANADGRFKTTFRKFSHATSCAVGSPAAFLLAVLVIVIWLVTGPMFHFSDTWQLVINTGTTIITFLMVFLIQNTQNRSDTAIQLKLDELIRAVDAARNDLVDLEDLSEDELRRLQKEFQRLRQSSGHAGAPSGALPGAAAQPPGSDV